MQFEKGWPPGQLTDVEWSVCVDWVKDYHLWLEHLPKDDKGNPQVPGRGLF